MKAQVIVIANQKGGVSKTTLTVNLGASMARMGYKVCLIDCDSQASMTMILGCHQPEELAVSIASIFEEILKPGFKLEKSELFRKREYILHNQGVDFIPSNIELAGTENLLVNAMSRENVLKKLVNYIKGDYDYILIDTPGALGFITINALNASDKILIPIQPQYLSIKGLELLLSTIDRVKDNLNPNLEIEGVLVTMYDSRLTFHREAVDNIHNIFAGLKVFETKIPISVRVTETQAKTMSIFDYDPGGKIAESYENFAKELLDNEREK